MRQLHALETNASIPSYSRILTRVEALASFGRQAVEAAEAYGSVVLDDVERCLPTRLKDARTTLGITREEAAMRTGFGQAEIDRLEDAGILSQFWKLDRYAQSLGLDVTAVTSSPDVIQSRFKENQLTPTGDLLSPAETTQLQKAVLEARYVGLVYVHLLTLRDRPQAMPTPSSNYGDARGKKSFQIGHDLAKGLRRQWALPPGPIESLSEICELHGIPIVAVDLPRQFSSLLIELPRGRAIAVSQNLMATRVLSARVAIAHELGHLHDPKARLDVLRLERSELEQAATRQGPNRDHVESRAGAFAAYFLAPQAQISEYVKRAGGPVDIASIIADVSAYWGMSFLAARDHIWNNARDVCPPDRGQMTFPSQNAQTLSAPMREFAGLDIEGLRKSRAGAFARLVGACLLDNLISRRSAVSMLALPDEDRLDDIVSRVGKRS